MHGTSRLNPATSPEAGPLSPGPLVIFGETLLELMVLSEIEWDSIPESERPAPAELVEGLGWVVAVSPGFPRL